MELLQHLKLIGVSESFEEEFANVLTRKELSKGAFLFQQGEICSHMFYIEKGLARIFYNSYSGKEITAWFSADNTFITVIDGFYNHKPTNDNCELLEDSIIYSIKYSDLQLLLHSSENARMAFYILFDITRKMSEYITSIKFQSAEERYTTLMNDYPSIFQRASLGYIASYLGITQETLSRIRAAK